MFCFQCQETIGNKGCTKMGACGKLDYVADEQDAIIAGLKKIALYADALIGKGEKIDDEINRFMTEGLFTTITNANFDEKSLAVYTKRSNDYYQSLKQKLGQDLGETSLKAGVLATENDDVRSLRELITYGLKGLAAYTHHAYHLGFEDQEVYHFIYKALAAQVHDNLSVDQLTALTLETGNAAVKAMALLDKANSTTYGNPEITKVNIGVRKNPAILVSGHDLKDIEQLLEQSKDSGVDIYTHSEMLPTHYYPEFKKYKNLAGNYGNAWHRQTEEFKTFNGPVIFTTNCIVPNAIKGNEGRVFTTNASGFPGCEHIVADSNGKKDFSKVIALAKTLPAPTEIESGEIIGGFAHEQVFALADKVVDAVKTGAIRKFVVMGGCDGRHKERSYYTEFAEKMPKDTVILTAGCAKYRYNKLNLGDIGGIPRVLDAGQCNDSYSLALIALKLKEVFGLDDINKLPIVYNIAWYEQKAVAVLLALLALGVKNIHLGPTLPAFLSPNVANVLVSNFGIAPVGSVDEDLQKLIG